MSVSSTTLPVALLLVLAIFSGVANALQPISRRSVLFAPAVTAAAVTLTQQPAFAATSNGLPLATAPSGLKWADAKVGSGQAFKSGKNASIDYSMASTGGRNPQLYSTKTTGAPYRWTLGDGSTIAGIEEAILGDGKDIPPMLPGGIRRVVVPQTLGYVSLAVPNAKCDDASAIGPIPPIEADFGAFNRWKQLYCNPRIPYQPDLVLDIKLYGKRTNRE
jgi:hypothetical protein